MRCMRAEAWSLGCLGAPRVFDPRKPHKLTRKPPEQHPNTTHTPKHQVNFAQGGSIFWALIIGFADMPLTAMQVLYVNLVTACTLGIMLAAEPAEPCVMDRPPRRPGKRLLVRAAPPCLPATHAAAVGAAAAGSAAPLCASCGRGSFRSRLCRLC